MAVLPDVDRVEIWAELMREYSRDGETIGILKPELRAAVNAVDQWLEDNAVSANEALPEPAKTVLTKQQKALIMLHVIQKRYLEDA